MPILPPAPPPSRSSTLEAASGSIESGFYALGYAPELDEIERRRDPVHDEFTYILHYSGEKGRVVERIPIRLNGIVSTSSPSNRTFLVGQRNALIELTSTGCVETTVSQLPGAATSIWDSQETLVICGCYPAFLAHYQSGVWTQVALPSDCPNLYSICGPSVNDLYIVGDNGWLAHFDGASVTRLPVPTTNHLTSIVPLHGQLYCAAGYGGTLMMGNSAGFRLVPTGFDDSPILSLASWADDVYIPSEQGLLRFDGRSAPSLVDGQACRWASSLDDGVLVVNNEQAWVFDSTSLTPLDTTV